MKIYENTKYSSSFAIILLLNRNFKNYFSSLVADESSFIENELFQIFFHISHIFGTSIIHKSCEWLLLNSSRKANIVLKVIKLLYWKSLSYFGAILLFYTLKNDKSTKTVYVIWRQQCCYHDFIFDFERISKSVTVPFFNCFEYVFPVKTTNINNSRKRYLINF